MSRVILARGLMMAIVLLEALRHAFYVECDSDNTGGPWVGHRTAGDTMRVYMVATEFSKYPAGRYMAHGPNSGERLRGELQYLLTQHDVIGVDFSGCLGQSPSFLDEAFRGLPAARVYTLNLGTDYTAVAEEAMT